MITITKQVLSKYKKFLQIISKTPQVNIKIILRHILSILVVLDTKKLCFKCLNDFTKILATF